MISLTRTDELLVGADPLTGSLDDNEPRVVRRPEAARRRFVAAGCAGLVAATTVVALAVVVPLIRSDGRATPQAGRSAATTALPTASEREQLLLVADRVETSPAVTPTRVITRERVLDYIDTATGRAYYWQTSTLTQVYRSQSTDDDLVLGQPRFLTGADRLRALSPVGDERIHVGRQHDVDPCGSKCLVIPQRVLHELTDDSPRALLAGLHRAIEAGVIGGCAEGPSCAAQNLVSLLRAPGTTAALRSSAVRAFAVAPGLSVSGYRTVNDQRGLALVSRNGFLNEDGPETLVIDISTGLVLSDETRLGPQGAADYGHRVAQGTVIDSLDVER